MPIKGKWTPRPTPLRMVCAGRGARCAPGGKGDGGSCSRWAAGSALAALGLLAAVLGISTLSSAGAEAIPPEPPFAVGNLADVPGILGHNLLVLALHAMACVAGFIAGSSLPLQADSHRGISRWVHEQGGRIAIAFVVCATTFSLSAQAYLLGDRLAAFSRLLGVPAALLLLAVLPTLSPS